MFADDINTLHKLVKKFKRFQKRYYPQITEENDNGEWEIGYKLWDEMNNAYLAIIEKYQAKCIKKNLLNDMLYVIARDSECSNLLIETLEYPEWFEILCRHCIKTNYYNAKWQFAEQLGSYKKESDVIELLFCFIESGDEYTERMALKSLCEHYPRQAEKYAVKFWERNIYSADEYQKMMALYALYKIKSPLLKKYITKSYETEYFYLKEWADRYANEMGENQFMEKWDLYTKYREKTGKECVRGEKIPNDLYHLTVHVWIRNSKGEYLISQRSASRPTFPLMWECAGGSVLKGESSIEGALREVKEEVGLDLQKDAGKLLFSKIRGGDVEYEGKVHNDIMDVWLFPYDGELQLEAATTDEVAACKWMTVSEIRKLYEEKKLVQNMDYFFCVMEEQIFQKTGF